MTYFYRKKRNFNNYNTNKWELSPAINKNSDNLLLINHKRNNSSDKKMILSFNNSLGEKKIFLNTGNLPKIYTPYSYLIQTSKVLSNKENNEKNFGDLAKSNEECEKVIKNTYSVKYLGESDNGNIGVLSKRIPFCSTSKIGNKRRISRNNEEIYHRKYIVNNYCLPKKFNQVKF